MTTDYKVIAQKEDGSTEEYLMDENGAVDCSDQDITTVVIGDKVRYLRCLNNKLTELRIPDSIVGLVCGNNPIKNLIIPNNVRYLDITDTEIEHLLLGKRLQYLYCDDSVTFDQPLRCEWSEAHKAYIVSPPTKETEKYLNN